MNRTLLLILLALPSQGLFAQSGDTICSQVFPRGLTIQIGLGSYAIRDEFISNEEYSGSLPSYSVSWTDVTNGRASRLSLVYRQSSDINNYNVSASITEFSFDWDYQYPLGNFSLFSKNVSVYLGPSPELFIHFRSQNLAKGGNALYRVYSFASLFSAATTLELALPIDDDLLVEASCRVNIISLGGRLVNSENSNQSFMKLVSPFSALLARTGLGIQYRILPGLHARFAYRSEFARISAWDYLVSISNVGALSLQYAF